MNRNTRILRFWALAAAAIVVAHLLDGVAFSLLRSDSLHDKDLGRFLRVMGFVPVWLTAATALALQTRTPFRALHRSAAGVLGIAPALSGAAAELLKLLIRRLRPGELGEYVFRSFAERPFSTGGLGVPSSHAAVAFAAAAVLSRIFPRAWAVWWTLGWGCALTRVASGAHFLSDVVVAAVVGWLVGVGLWQWHSSPTQRATEHLHRALHHR